MTEGDAISPILKLLGVMSLFVSFLSHQPHYVAVGKEDDESAMLGLVLQNVLREFIWTKNKGHASRQQVSLSCLGCVCRGDGGKEA